MKFFLLSILFLVAQEIKAQDLNKEENKFLGYIYQQQEYQINDPKGDILLLWTNRQIPHFIFKTLKGKQQEVIRERAEKIAELLKVYPEFAPKEEKKNLFVEEYIDYNTDDLPFELEGHKAPFKVKNLTLMMEQVIAEEHQLTGLTPKLGTVHEWSPEIKKQLKKKFFLFGRFSKLLMALSRGSTSNFMVTGTEEQLTDYILARPVNSITLEEMFRTSYRINQGDVYLSLLTIENLLARYWLTPKRTKRAFTTKLKDITNYNYRTDKFGSWYHLFGIMLYGYAEGGLKSTIVGTLETWGSHILGGLQDEKQEDYINRRGGPVGGRLRKFIEKKEYEKFELNKTYLEEEFYLDLDEDFSKRLEKAQKKAS